MFGEGLAFERVCLEHTDCIKKKLGISGVLTEEKSWSSKGNPEKGTGGTQIDLLIVRRDQIINLCEMKYSNSEYRLTEKVDSDIRRRIYNFKEETGTKYTIHPILITPYGLVDNSYAQNIQGVISMEDLYV